MRFAIALPTHGSDPYGSDPLVPKLLLGHLFSSKLSFSSLPCAQPQRRGISPVAHSGGMHLPKI